MMKKKIYQEEGVGTMQVTFMQTTIEKWLHQQYHCQFVQRHWQAGIELKKAPMILSQINQQLTELLGSQSKMTLNELRDFQAEWLGLQLEGQVVRQAVIIQDYRNSLFKREKFIRNQCLALLIFTQHFPEVPVRVIGVLPQLEPAIVIDLERKVTEIQSYWAHEHIQANLEIVIYQPRTAVASRGQRNRSGAENIRNTTVSLIKKAKINQEICKSLQDIRFCKTMFGENQFGGESVTYEGVGGTKKWERLESYGPKFVENIVQAISRDILMYSMKMLSTYRIVAHVHDEVIIEADSQISVNEVCKQMSQVPPWAKGLLLDADGYECEFYQKD